MDSKASALRSAMFIAVIAIAAHGADSAQCIYGVYVKTGTVDSAGTDSTISLVLGNAEGAKYSTNGLVSWGGLMESSHDYFENGNLDIFGGVGVCLNGPICSLQILSDGKGNKPGWFCDYVEVSSTGSGTPCYKKKFNVNHWIAIDEPPYQLSFSTNLCNKLSNATI